MDKSPVISPDGQERNVSYIRREHDGRDAPKFNVLRAVKQKFAKAPMAPSTAKLPASSTSVKQNERRTLKNARQQNMKAASVKPKETVIASSNSKFWGMQDTSSACTKKTNSNNASSRSAGVRVQPAFHRVYLDFSGAKTTGATRPAKCDLSTDASTSSPLAATPRRFPNAAAIPAASLPTSRPQRARSPKDITCASENEPGVSATGNSAAKSPTLRKPTLLRVGAGAVAQVAQTTPRPLDGSALRRRPPAPKSPDVSTSSQNTASPRNVVVSTVASALPAPASISHRSLGDIAAQPRCNLGADELPRRPRPAIKKTHPRPEAGAAAQRAQLPLAVALRRGEGAAPQMQTRLETDEATLQRTGARKDLADVAPKLVGRAIPARGLDAAPHYFPASSAHCASSVVAEVGSLRCVKPTGDDPRDPICETEQIPEARAHMSSMWFAVQEHQFRSSPQGTHLARFL